MRIDATSGGPIAHTIEDSLSYFRKNSHPFAGNHWR